MSKPLMPLAPLWRDFEARMLKHPDVSPALMSVIKVSFYAGAKAAASPLKGEWLGALMDPLVAVVWSESVCEEAEEVLK